MIIIIIIFWDTNGSSNLGQMARPSDCQQKKRKKEKKTCQIVDFAILADHGVKTEGKWKER